MAFNPAPNAWIASWAEDGTDVTFPIASVPELTAAEADGATGDIRKVLFALCEKINAVWAATATADRPTRMAVYKSVQNETEAGIDQVTFMLRFDRQITAQDVADEPA